MHGLATAPTATTHGITITYPHTTRLEMTSITNPVQRIVVYSGPRPEPLAAPRQDQTLAILMESVPPRPADVRRFPPRPRTFRITRLGFVKSFAGDRWKEITFRDHHRAFYLFVWIGRKATRMEPALLASLNSLQIANP
jgi:hypothetical protein